MDSDAVESAVIAVIRCYTLARRALLGTFSYFFRYNFESDFLAFRSFFLSDFLVKSQCVISINFFVYVYFSTELNFILRSEKPDFGF